MILYIRKTENGKRGNRILPLYFDIMQKDNLKLLQFLGKSDKSKIIIRNSAVFDLAKCDFERLARFEGLASHIPISLLDFCILSRSH